MKKTSLHGRPAGAGAAGADDCLGAHPVPVGAARKAKAAAQKVADTNVTDDPVFVEVSDVFASRRYCARLPLRRGSSRLSPHAVRCSVLWSYRAQDGRTAECLAAVNVSYRSRTAAARAPGSPTWTVSASRRNGKRALGVVCDSGPRLWC